MSRTAVQGSVRAGWEIVELALRHAFVTTHGASVARRNVVVTLRDAEGRIGRGEAPPYYGETADGLAAELDERGFDAVSPSLRSAIEVARLDLEGQTRGVTVCELFGGDPLVPIRTSLTLGQATPDELARKAEEARAFPVLKIKVGTERDDEGLRAIRAAHPSVELRADANGAWTEDEAPQRIEVLARHGVRFIEQPIPPGDAEALARVRSRSALPIFADESVRDVEDVRRLEGAADGIVVKLGKCGGPARTLACIDAARALGMQVMIGCMVESSVGITAAAHLAYKCDLADLDGHLLLARDPFEGVTLEPGGILRLPRSSGLGVAGRLAACS